MAFDPAKELDKVISSDHHDPFVVLGYHQIEGDPERVVVRTFQPHAESIDLILEDGASLPMYKMREVGLFEAETPYTEPFNYHFEALFPHGDKKKIIDPYQFLPQLSELDRHLFNSGTLYKAYKVLGAQVRVINGIRGVLFRTWAPSARRVSIVGDFNYWDGRVHQMRSLGSSGVWELFIPGLTTGDAYKFEIRSSYGQIIEKADPYQFFAEIRPKTASVVWDMDDYTWNDQEWQQAKRKESPWESPLSIYEVHLGSWMRDPAEPDRFLSFRELADKLIPYAEEMGFTHIELMPIMEHPLDESWGYQVTGYYSVTSRMGTPTDFKYFIDCCHAKGIGVILDWVPSHFPTDGHCFGRFDGSALYEHADPRQGHHPEWGTYIFNYGRSEVKSFLISNALFWFDIYHVDGLRVDAVASMLYLDYARRPGEWIPNQYGGKENIEAIEFLRHLNSIVYREYPNCLMVAEESTSFYGVSKSADAGGLGFGFKWNMGWMNDTLSYFKRDPLFRKYHHNALTFSLLYAFTENFILPLSHDEVVHGKGSLVTKMPGDTWQRFANLRLLFTYMWMHPGKKLLFMGGEFGQFSEWYCKVSLDWHLPEESENHRQLQECVKELNTLYRANPSLWEQDFIYEGFRWMDFKDADHSIIAFSRSAKSRDDHVVCLMNFTPQPHDGYKLGVPAKRRYREIFNSDQTGFGGSGITNDSALPLIDEPFGEAAQHVIVTVPPLAGIILKPE